MSEDIKHVCEFCKKNVDISVKTIPPTWYGKFQGSHILIGLTCAECLKDAKKNESWRKQANVI